MLSNNLYDILNNFLIINIIINYRALLFYYALLCFTIIMLIILLKRISSREIFFIFSHLATHFFLN